LEKAYENLHTAALHLAACSGCWHIASQGAVHDSKYHAGASHLVKRNPTTIKRAAPGFLQTNVETVAINVGRQTMYFFPDRCLVFDAGRVGAVGV
jgi:hypothetical protein